MVKVMITSWQRWFELSFVESCFCPSGTLVIEGKQLSKYPWRPFNSLSLKGKASRTNILTLFDVFLGCNKIPLITLLSFLLTGN